jgi:aminopeptidase N
MRVETESWIGYQKGALAMYLLQERMGEDAVNRALRALLARYRFRDAPYPRSLDLVNALRAEARGEEEQRLITDLFERVVLYDLKVTAPTAVQRADGKWDVTVPVTAKKLEVDSAGADHEMTLDERIEVGLFSAEPGSAAPDAKQVIAEERRPIRSGTQVLRFVTDRRPAYAAIDPDGFYIDRNSADNVSPMAEPKD